MIKKDSLWLLAFLLLSYIITGIMLMILAFLVYRFQIGEGIVNLSILGIYAISAFTGGFCAGKKQKTKKFIWGFIMGGAYFMILFVVTLLVNHTIKDFSGNFFTILTICTASGMLGGMLGN